MIWNIIDRRKRPFRWAKVHAIIEAAWHDNSVSGADQAPGTTLETEITFDEREDVSVHEAINWANSQSCPVTLYLSDGEWVQKSSNDEVEAAARALDTFGRNNGWWSSDRPSYDDLDDARRVDFEFIAQAILSAAAKARADKSA